MSLNMLTNDCFQSLNQRSENQSKQAKSIRQARNVFLDFKKLGESEGMFTELL